MASSSNSLSVVRCAHGGLAHLTLVKELLIAIGDSSSSQVVSGNLYLNPISGKDADMVFSHLAAQVTKNFVSVIQLDTKVTALKRFNSLSFEQDGVVLLFRQTSFPSIAVSISYRTRSTSRDMSMFDGIELFLW